MTMLVVWTAVAGVAVALGAGAARADDPEWEALALLRAPGGIAAPDFTLADVDGRRVGLAALRGRAVFLNFWASWCIPCEMEMPAMGRLQERLEAADAVVVAVNYREPPARVRAFLRRHALRFPVLLDTDGAVASRYRVVTLPFTVLIDAAGQVRAVAEGPRDWDSPAAASVLRRLARPRD